MQGFKIGFETEQLCHNCIVVQYDCSSLTQPPLPMPVAGASMGNGMDIANPLLTARRAFTTTNDQGDNHGLDQT